MCLVPDVWTVGAGRSGKNYSLKASIPIATNFKGIRGSSIRFARAVVLSGRVEGIGGCGGARCQTAQRLQLPEPESRQIALKKARHLSLKITITRCFAASVSTPVFIAAANIRLIPKAESKLPATRGCSYARIGQN
jgi:hypothetical protein